MLDPKGSQLGNELSPEDLSRMTEEEKRNYEGEQIMRGLGNKCARKGFESMFMAACIMAALYYSGWLNYVLYQMNPSAFESLKEEAEAMAGTASGGASTEL